MDNHAATLAQHLRLRLPSQWRVARNIVLSLLGGFGWVVVAMGTSDHLYSGFAGKVQWFTKRFGWKELFLLPLRKIISPLVLPFLTPRHFKYCDGLLPCHFANYNVTWSNERCVEVSLGRWYLEQVDGPVLEIGHVLGHYGMNEHTVLDKFEKAKGVINEDIISWQTDLGLLSSSPSPPLSTLALMTMPRTNLRKKFSPALPLVGRCCNPLDAW